MGPRHAHTIFVKAFHEGVEAVYAVVLVSVNKGDVVPAMVGNKLTESRVLGPENTERAFSRFKVTIPFKRIACLHLMVVEELSKRPFAVFTGSYHEQNTPIARTVGLCTKNNQRERVKGKFSFL